MEGPCWNCTDRKPKCHSVCELYKEYRAKLDAIAAKKKKESDGGYVAGINMIPRTVSSFKRKKRREY